MSEKDLRAIPISYLILGGVLVALLLLFWGASKPASEETEDRLVDKTAPRSNPVRGLPGSYRSTRGSGPARIIKSPALANKNVERPGVEELLSKVSKGADLYELAGEIRKHARASRDFTAALIASMEDPDGDPEQKALAALVLGSLSWPEARLALQRELLRTDDVEWLKTLTLALGISDRFPFSRVRGAYVIEHPIGLKILLHRLFLEESEVSLLGSFLSHESPDVRETVRSVLGPTLTSKLLASRQGVSPVVEIIIEKIVERVVEEKVEKIRSEMARDLATWITRHPSSQPKQVDATRRLLDVALKPEAVGVRLTTGGRLGRADLAPAVRDRLRKASKEGDLSTRSWAMGVLGSNSHRMPYEEQEKFSKDLAAALKDPNSKVREWAVRSIADASGFSTKPYRLPNAEELLTQALEDPAWNVRFAAQRALGFISVTSPTAAKPPEKEKKPEATEPAPEEAQIVVTPEIEETPEEEWVAVIVGFNGEPDANVFGETDLRGGAVLKSANAIAWQMPPGLVPMAEAHPQVAYIEEDAMRYADAKVSATASSSSMAQTTEWGITNVRAPNVWSRDSNKGSGVIVAVLDTGIDLDHPDIAANVWNNAGEMGDDGDGGQKESNGEDDDGNGFVDDYQGWIFANKTKGGNYSNRNVPDDDDTGIYHGTHVSGIVAALDNSIDMVGVAPEAEIMVVKVLDNEGGGTTSEIISGTDYALDMGAHVISMSLGGEANERSELDSAKLVYDTGVLFVVSAGNEADDFNEPTFPGAYYWTVGVGATQESSPNSSPFNDSELDEWSYFSTYGAQVYVSAPGRLIESLTRVGTGPGSNDNTLVLSGTSMACPHVSGVAALVIASDKSRYTYTDGGGIERVNVYEMWVTLLLSTEEKGWTGWDEFYGYGEVDALDAVDYP